MFFGIVNEPKLLWQLLEHDCKDPFWWGDTAGDITTAIFTKKHLDCRWRILCETKSTDLKDKNYIQKEICLF